MITKLKKSSIDTRKTITDKTSKIITSTLAWLFSLVFVALIGFIIYASVPGYPLWSQDKPRRMESPDTQMHQ